LEKAADLDQQLEKIYIQIGMRDDSHIDSATADVSMETE